MCSKVEYQENVDLPLAFANLFVIGMIVNI